MMTVNSDSHGNQCVGWRWGEGIPTVTILDFRRGVHMCVLWMPSCEHLVGDVSSLSMP